MAYDVNQILQTLGQAAIPIGATSQQNLPPRPDLGPKPRIGQGRVRYNINKRKAMRNWNQQMAAAGQPQRSGAGRFFLGDPAQKMVFDRFTPLQTQALTQALGHGLGLLGEYKPVDFSGIEQDARNQFENVTIPSILGRFGNLNAQDSSSLRTSLGAAASDLEKGLAGMRGQFGLQQNQQLSDFLGRLLALGTQPQFENIFSPAQPGLLQGLIPSLFGAAGQLGGAALGRRF